MIVTLPVPPSVNRIYRYNSRGMYKTRAGRDWISASAWQIKAECTPLETAVVSLDAHFPDLRKRDLDNLLKCTLDAVVKSGVISDDNWRVLSLGHLRGHLDRENPRLELDIAKGPSTT